MLVTLRRSFQCDVCFKIFKLKHLLQRQHLSVRGFMTRHMMSVYGIVDVETFHSYMYVCFWYSCRYTLQCQLMLHVNWNPASADCV